MPDTPLASDWKTFRKRTPEWRERYLREKNSEIVAILNGAEGTPTERFWRAEERIKKEAKILRDCLDGHTKSKMTLYMGMMIRYGLIKVPDLDEFSESLRKYMIRLLEL